MTNCLHLVPRFELDRTINMRPGSPRMPAPSLFIRSCFDCGHIITIKPVYLVDLHLDGTAHMEDDERQHAQGETHKWW